MQRPSARLHLLLLLFLHLLGLGLLQEFTEDPLEVITESSPCSETCGVGIKTEKLCTVEDNEAATEEREDFRDDPGVTENCRVRTVMCRDMWNCGIRTMTVSIGQRVELDCVGSLLAQFGKFTYRVSWHYARGIISSDDTFFKMKRVPQLDQYILQSIREEDAGTYRCDVQDAQYSRLKRIYWGIRVQPDGFLNLDYESALKEWDEIPEEVFVPTDLTIFHMVLISVSVASVLTGLVVVWLVVVKKKGNTFCKAIIFSINSRRNTSAPL